MHISDTASEAGQGSAKNIKTVRSVGYRMEVTDK